MKTIQKRWLPLFLLAAVTFFFPACEGNNPSIDGDDGTSGLITVKMRNDGNTWIQLPGLSCFHMTSANNFQVYAGEMIDMGKTTLSHINTIPSSGWAYEVAVEPKHSYIYRYVDWNIYLKVYVKDFLYSTSGGIIGAEVQYCEWDPEQ